MNRSRIAFFALSALAVGVLLGGGLLGATTPVVGEPEDDSLYKVLAVFTEVLGLVRQAYVDETDLTRLMEGALDGTTDALDPFSIFVPAAEVDAFLSARDANARTTGLTLLKDRGVVFVVAVEPGSPAEAAGLRASDLVAKIDGRSTRTMPLWEAQERLAASAEGGLKLELLRLGEAVELTFQPRPWTAEAARYEVSQEAEPQAILRVVRFAPETPAAVAAALARAGGENRERLLVDLRDVAGGDAKAAYDVAGLFAGGDLGALERKGEVLQTFEDGDGAAWKGTVVVLVSRGTLGPAEILATVLRRRIGAELVGERTFGWAGRQDSAPIGEGGRLFFTDAFYAGPDGEPLTSGLAPDVEVDNSGRDFASRDKPLADRILQRGLERLREKAAEAALPRAA